MGKIDADTLMQSHAMLEGGKARGNVVLVGF